MTTPYDTLLRWCLPIDHPREQRRVLQSLWQQIPSYTRPIGGVTTCYASRHSGEARFTLFTTDSHAEHLTDRLRELFSSEPTRAVTAPRVLTDPILGPDLAWYRRRLHQISDVALSIRDDTEHMSYRLLLVTLDALPDPARLYPSSKINGQYETELRGRLVDLAGPAIERAMREVIDGKSFWSDFARRPHRNGDVLGAPGHLLWNLLR